MKVVPLRLPPGADLRRALEAWMAEQQEQAGCVISAVGSLSVAQLRLAGATQATAIHGELEILSGNGGERKNRRGAVDGNDLGWGSAGGHSENRNPGGEGRAQGSDGAVNPRPSAGEHEGNLGLAPDHC